MPAAGTSGPVCRFPSLPLPAPQSSVCFLWKLHLEIRSSSHTLKAKASLLNTEQ